MAGGGGRGDRRYTGGWEAARHPVLYDNFYLVQYLLDIKGQIYTSGNCRPVIKQNLIWQLPASSF